MTVDSPAMIPPFLPDLGLVTKLVVRYMLSTSDSMRQASDAHLEEIADDALPKEEFEKKRRLLRGIYIATRANIDTQFGQVGIKTLGLEGTTPTNADELVTMSQRLVKNLRSPELKLPAPLMTSLAPDRGVLADEIEAAINALNLDKEKVSTEERELEGTLATKHASIEAHDVTFGRCARWLESTYNLAGATDLANKIRPSKKRPGTLDSVTLEPTDLEETIEPPVEPDSPADTPETP